MFPHRDKFGTIGPNLFRSTPSNEMGTLLMTPGDGTSGGKRAASRKKAAPKRAKKAAAPKRAKKAAR